MPTIRVTASDGQCVYDADRVVRDSQVLVVEAWREHAWRRVGTFRAADVLGVHRFVPRSGDNGVWLPEDVRFAAGVALPPRRLRPLQPAGPGCSVAAPGPAEERSARQPAHRLGRARTGSASGGAAEGGTAVRVLLAGTPGVGKGTQGTRRAGVRFILDGYPRTLAQARHVDETAATLDVVVHLVVPREELLRRLLAHGRQDDTADVVAHRLEVYEQQTAPLLATYAADGRLVMVEGTATIDEVGDRMVRELQVWRLRRPLAV